MMAKLTDPRFQAVGEGRGHTIASKAGDTVIVVPSSVMELFGGDDALQMDDPPLLITGVIRSGERWWGVNHPSLRDEWGGAQSWPGTGDGYALPQSAPALLRVLARHMGMTMEPGEGLGWRWVGDGWVLSKWDHSSAQRWWFPALAGITDPMAALAAVLVHEAERARANTGDTP